MVADVIVQDSELTGLVRTRSTWLGGVRLEVQVATWSGPANPYAKRRQHAPALSWRRAKSDDLLELLVFGVKFNPSGTPWPARRGEA